MAAHRRHRREHAVQRPTHRHARPSPAETGNRPPLPAPKGNVGPRLGVAYSPKGLPKTVFRGGFGIMYGNYRQYESGLQHFQPPYVDESFLNNDVPAPRFTMQTLWPVPVTDLAGADLTNVTLNYLRDKTVPTYYQWNFNVQRELPHNVLLQLGYVGNKGVNLP